MKNFIFNTPTKVLFGKDTEKHIGSLVKSLGKTKPLILYGGGSAVKSGLIARVEKSLKDEGIDFITRGGVKANPRLGFAKQMIELAKQEKVDFLLGVGGGSVIDTAKGVALGISNPEVDIWDFYTGVKQPEKTCGVGVVLTISAAGSETSNSSVLTKEDELMKMALNHEINRPVFAIMNPENTFTLPKYQVCSGIVDIIMHTLERYFTLTEGNETTDQIAEAILRVTIEKGRIAAEDNRDYDAMSELMWCGSLSHNGLTGLGAVSDFATHQLGHQLSAIYDVAHGASLSSVWGSWARYVYKEKPERFARYAKNVWGISEKDPARAALLGIEATEEYFTSIGMPVSMPELRIGVLTEADLKKMTDLCTRYNKRTIGQFKVLVGTDILSIYQMANTEK